MEAYKTTCQNSDCGHVEFWMGYKTGMGKTQEQLKEMHRRRVTCVKCGAIDAKTEFDRESETGKIFAEMDDMVLKVLKEVIADKIGGNGVGGEHP